MAHYKKRNCEVCGKEYIPMNKNQRACNRQHGRVIWSLTNIEKTRTQVEEYAGQPAKDWLEQQYNSGKTIKQLCEEMGIGHTQRLVRLMKHIGIRIRSKSEEQELVWRNNPELMKFFISHGAKVNREMSLKRPTSIERIMSNALTEAGIKYEFQGLVEKIYPCDFVLWEHKVIVECDGEYWHSKPEAQLKDAKKDVFLHAKGWTIIRFSDKIIKKNIQQCIQSIQSLISS